MRRNKSILHSVILLVTLFVTAAQAGQGWKRVDLTLGGAEIRGGVIDVREKQRIFVMTSSGLYAVNLLSPFKTGSRLLSEAVNDVFVGQELILAATDQGLFSSKDSGRTWQQELRDGVSSDVTVMDDRFLLATENGVYERSHSETTWRRMPGILGRENVRKLWVLENGFYALTPQALYFLEAGQQEAKKIFSRGSVEESSQSVEGEDEDVAEGWMRELVDIFVGHEGIYLAARDGLFVSRDGGATWRSIHSAGETSGDISTVVAVTGDDGRELVCVGSSKGVACGREEKFTAVYAGMEDSDVRRLAVINERGLLASTRRGVYSIDDVSGKSAPAGASDSGASCVFKDYAGILEEFAHEPTVREVQSLAVNYADANKSKIDAWQRQSRIKALLPHVSVGVDRNFSEKYHWDTGPNPDNIQKGRTANDWDASLTWELSDLIWSTDQTSIDSRSKLMVELREEIIDQVTRIYFERRRLQVELSACAYGNTGDRMAAEMRVDELTALLDGYTGGSFSQRSNQHSPNNQPRRGKV